MGTRVGPVATVLVALVATVEVDFAHHRGRGVTAPGAVGSFEIRWIGTRTYWRGAGMPETNGKWLELGPGGGEEGISVSPFATFLFSEDPLGLLHASPADAVTVGHDTVRGVATTHLRLTLDLRGLTRELRSQGYTLDDPPTPTVSAEAWVDAQGRLRRLTSTDASSDPPAAVSFELFDYGVHVDVEAPPADQILRGDSTSASSSLSATPPTGPAPTTAP